MGAHDSHKHELTPECPRCHVPLEEVHAEEASIDRCKRCGGTFFDQGEMLTALGRTADASFWDRPENLGPLRDSGVKCPRCGGFLLLQTVSGDGAAVDIDRCPRCRGIWLDPGEGEKLLAVGARMLDKVLAERRAAQAELDKLGEVNFSPPGLIARFLALFRPV
jgi:Zn-finger nucleic acid-binding protein